MTIQARTLSAEQKRILEDLLGQTLAETETIHLRTAETEPGPAWLHDFWPQSAHSHSLVKLQPFTYPQPVNRRDKSRLPASTWKRA